MQINLSVSLWTRRAKFAHIATQSFLDAFAKKIMSASEIRMTSPIGFCKVPKSKVIPGND
jgi:hypothetical protein